MVKMNMRKIEDRTKQLEDENNSIEMRYRATICNDCKKEASIVLYSKVIETTSLL